MGACSSKKKDAESLMEQQKNEIAELRSEQKLLTSYLQSRDEQLQNEQRKRVEAEEEFAQLDIRFQEERRQRASLDKDLALLQKEMKQLTQQNSMLKSHRQQQLAKCDAQALQIKQNREDLQDRDRKIKALGKQIINLKSISHAQEKHVIEVTNQEVIAREQVARLEETINQKVRELRQLEGRGSQDRSRDPSLAMSYSTSMGKRTMDTALFNRELFQQLCLTNRGTLYQDNVMSVEYLEAIHALPGRCHGTWEMTFQHNGGVGFSTVDVRLDCREEDLQGLELTPLPGVQPGTVVRTVNFELMSYFKGPLRCRVDCRLADNSLHVAQFDIPLLVSKFLVPLDLDADAFLNLWWDTQLHYVQSAVQVSPAQAIVPIVTFGGTFKTVSYQINPENISHRWRDTQISESSVLAAALMPRHGEVGDSRCLLRCWIGSGPASGAVKIEIKCEDKELAELILASLVPLLGQAMQLD